MTIAGGHEDIKSGTKWIGTDGWVWVDRGGFDASNPDWKKGKSLPEEFRKVKLYESNGHQRNFLDCVKSRKPTITPVETAHHSAIPGHLGLISMLVGPQTPLGCEARENPRLTARRPNCSRGLTARRGAWPDFPAEPFIIATNE